MSDVVVYDNPKWKPSKHMMYGAIAIVVVVIVAVGFVIYRNNQKNDQKLNAAFKTAAAVNGPDAKAGDDAKALSRLQTASALAKSNQQKVELYSDLASSYESNGNPQEALHYLQLKHQLDPSTAGADALTEAQIYQQLNENSLAITEYKQAISYIKSQSTISAPQKSMAVENYNGIIQSLGGSQ